MKVTKITTNSLSPAKRGVCGEFTVVLDNDLCIRKVRVINGAKGLFIAFPNSGEVNDTAEGRRFIDVVYPTNNTLRNHISSEVLSFYNEEVRRNGLISYN